MDNFPQENGYIKLYRKLLDNPVFQNERLLKVFIWCLLKASYKEHEQLLGLQTIRLKPGQFIYGRLKAAQEVRLKPSTMNDQMKALKKLQIIDIKPNNKFSIVSVINWGVYQSSEDEPDNKTDSKPTTKQQQTDTNKKGKKDKNIYTSEFETFYSSYPYQLNKQQSFKNWTALLKKGESVSNIMKALENYLNYISDNKIEKQYIVRSANFIGRNAVYLGYLETQQNHEEKDWRWDR